MTRKERLAIERHHATLVDLRDASWRSREGEPTRVTSEYQALDYAQKVVREKLDRD